MNRVVVDTDVVSFLFKGDTRSEFYGQHLSGKQCIISFMTLAELYRWALVGRWGEKRKVKLEEHLKQFAVHPFNAKLCKIWAEVSFAARQSGYPIETADAWIAATALYHEIALVTHNKSHYRGVSRLVVISELGT